MKKRKESNKAVLDDVKICRLWETMSMLGRKDGQRCISIRE